MTYDPKNWQHRDPDKLEQGYGFMNAQGTPFYYALFHSFEDAIAARELYLHNIRKAERATLMNVAKRK